MSPAAFAVLLTHDEAGVLLLPDGGINSHRGLLSRDDGSLICSLQLAGPATNGVASVLWGLCDALCVVWSARFTQAFMSCWRMSMPTDSLGYRFLTGRRMMALLVVFWRIACRQTVV